MTKEIVYEIIEDMREQDFTAVVHKPTGEVYINEKEVFSWLRQKLLAYNTP